MNNTPVNAWLVIDKPKGMTSAQVVGRVRRLTGTKKVGHAGTLDPLATGVLPIALGEATKTVAYAMEDRKSYRFELTFGENRETDDAEGTVTATSSVRPSLTQLQSIIPDFIGAIQQVPPAYSAIKVQGKRAYALARAGKVVQLTSREVMIYRCDLLTYDGERATFEVDCGKGTYIRSLARDIAGKVGACGYVSDLRRIMVGKFLEKDAISLDKLEEIVHNPRPNAAFKPVDWVLDDILGLVISSEQVSRIRQGQQVFVGDFCENSHGEKVVVKTEAGGELIALGTVEDGMLKPARVFNI